MNMSAGEKTALLSMWDKISPQADDLGAKVLNRFYLESPQAKPYFVRFKLTPGSADLKTHGGKIMNAFGSAAHHLDDLAGNLSPLMDLGVDPGNIGPLSHSMKKVLASVDSTSKYLLSLDKFLERVAITLVKRIRQ
ncbi:hemoglobin subunit alpha-3-like [Lithobates pipiens]